MTQMVGSLPYIPAPSTSYPLHLTATTTGAAETVTITQLTISKASRIHWGDGQSEVVAANSVAALNHVYASAGTYNVAVENALYVTGLRLDNAKLGGLNTAELRYSAVNYFYVTAITGSTIRSADMTAWRPTSWRLSSMPAGTYSIDSADMVDWRSTTWLLSSMPAGTYSIDSADMVDWRPTNWWLYSMPAGGTYNIASADMVAWRPTTWVLYAIPAGTYNIASADMAAWSPSAWYLYSMPAGGTYNIASADMAAWTTAQTIYCHTMPAAGSSYTFAASALRNIVTARDLRFNDLGLDAPTVDVIVKDIWAGKANFTFATPQLYIGGTNADPTGVYGAVCPPVDGLEYVYDLVNGNCTPAGPEWAVSY